MSNRGDRSRRNRPDRRYRPTRGEGDLEPRRLLSFGAGPRLTAEWRNAVAAQALSRASASAISLSPLHPPRGQYTITPSSTHRLTPTAKINAEYASFLADFRKVESAYIQSINDQASGTVAVAASVTSVYSIGSSVMQVDNASVFGPVGTFSTPVIATATIGNVLVGQYVLNGRVDNSTLIVDPTQSTQASLPVGAVLSANVPATSQSSAAAIFPSFITNRANEMAISLVQYFNNQPTKLPRFNAPPHTPNQRGAIQKYVYQQIVGSASTSLLQSLLAIPLPTTTGPDLTIYDAAVNSAVVQSRTQTLNGVRQVFAGKLLVPIPAPNNRLGVLFNTGSSGGSTTGSSGGSTTGSIGGTTTGQ